MTDNGAAGRAIALRCLSIPPPITVGRNECSASPGQVAEIAAFLRPACTVQLAKMPVS
jgi:hypothetical protein